MAVGKAVIASCDLAINQDLKALYPKSVLLDEYLHFLMIFREEEISNLGTGSTVKGVRLETIKQLQVRIPLLDEQRTIIGVMNSAELTVRNLMGNHELLTAQKKALMQQLLTGKRRVIVDQETA
ncbi:MAG: restriction endonuclease subunit S [Magnetococcus sp. YQC-3]